jgi:PhnB protein
MTMPDRPDQLDALVDQLLADRSVFPDDAELETLVDIARDLIDLPREEFRTGLSIQLERTAAMTTTTRYIPAGLNAVTPYLLLRDPIAAIDFYTGVFDAIEVMRHEEGGHVVHAKLRIGGSMVEMGQHGDRTDADVLDLPPVGVHLYVEDVDAVLAKASAAGSRVLVPIMDQPYGDREVSIADPFGIVWFLATHLQD